jgi:phosphohistidine phosphatase
MTLFLVQHGKNHPKEIDPDQGLSEEGRAEVKRIAEVAKSYKIKIKEIRHSGKKRARETAEIFAEILKVKKPVDQMDGLKPMNNVVPIAKKMGVKKNVMLVGHLPFMERITSYLTTGNKDITVFKFQNGGIVCLDKLPAPNGWVIKWTLMPNIGKA